MGFVGFGASTGPGIIGVPSTAGSAPWTPFQFGASLVLWCDMTDASTVTVTGGNVTQVADKSGNGWTMTPSGNTPPVYQASLLNGNPCAQFVDNNNILATSASLTLAQPNTVFCLFIQGGALDSNGFVWDGNITESGARQIFLANDAAIGNKPALYAGSSVAVGSTLVAPSYNISIAQLNGQWTNSAVNAQTSVVVNPGTAGITGGFKLGGLASNNLNASICIWGIVNRNLTFYERQKLEGYMAWTVGLPAALLPASHPYYSAPPLANDAIQTTSTYPGIFSGTVYPVTGVPNFQYVTFLHSDSGGGIIGNGIKGNVFGVLSLSVAVSGYYLIHANCGFIGTYTGSSTAGYVGMEIDGVCLDGCDANGIPNGTTYQNVVNPTNQLYWRVGLLAGTHNLGVSLFGDSSIPLISNPGYPTPGTNSFISLLSAGLPKEPYGTRDPTIYPLSSYHYYNTPVGTNAVASLLTDADQVQLSAIQGGNVNIGSFSTNIYVGRSSDPVQLAQSGDTLLTPLNPSPWHMPAGMTGSPSDPSDMGMGLVDLTQTRWGVSGFGTIVNAAPATYGIQQVQQLVSDNYNGWNHGQTQNQFLFGVIRAQEVLAGAINHMLLCSLQEGNLKNIVNQFLGLQWPAAQADFNAPSTYTGQIPYGSRLYIPKSVNLAAQGLSAGGLILATCLQNFGATIQITQGGGSGGPLDFYHEGTNQSDSTLMSQMLTDLQAVGSGGNNKIVPLIRIMRNDGPNSIGGGGDPLVPTLPGCGTLTG